MKIVIAPDSFKHSLSAAEVCDSVARAARKVWPLAQIKKTPVADGGEGTADSLLGAADGRKIFCKVKGPLFNEVESFYCALGDTAVIELAAICGLTMVERPNPEATTTFGVGEMMIRAMDDGFKKIILCVGGSATNDAGVGLASALGMKFFDSNQNEIVPRGGELKNIFSIDARGFDRRVFDCEIKIACDVTNPLYGINGAAHVFAPQKGADAEAVTRLDEGLRNVAAVLKNHTGVDVSQIPGCGAAGGVAACLLALGAAALTPGVGLVLDAIGFDEKIEGADLVITGEGKTDSQTLSGKTVLGVARRAAKKNIPVIVISGAVEDGVDEFLYKEGVLAVFPCCRMAEPFEKIRDRCGEWLYLTALNVFKTR